MSTFRWQIHKILFFCAKKFASFVNTLICRARIAFAIIFARGTEIAALQRSYYIL